MFKAALGWARQARIRSMLIFGCVALLLIFGLFYHLGSSPRDLSQAELMSKNNASSLSFIYHNPVNAPHQLLLYALIKLGLGGNRWFRFSSGVFAIIFVVSFYSLVRNWFGKSIGIFSTILFFSLPIFITAGRQASTEVMFFCPVAIMACYYWLIRVERNRAFAWLLLALVCGLFIYVPGMAWWLAGAAIICRSKISSAIAELPSLAVGVGLAVFTVLLVPAALSIAHDWRLVKLFTLIPAHWQAPLQLLKNLGWMLSSLIVKTPYHTPLIINRLPFLNIIQIALLALGSYAMWTSARPKALLLSLGVVLAVVVAAINDNVNLLILGLPVMAIFIAAGLRYLYIEWRSVFPSNPIPRSLAITLIACLIATQVAFGLSYGLVAWPHSLATRTAYVLK